MSPLSDQEMDRHFSEHRLLSVGQLFVLVTSLLCGGCAWLDRHEEGFRNEDPALRVQRPHSTAKGEQMGLSSKSREIERHLGIE